MQAGSAPAASLEAIAAVGGLVAVLVGPGLVLLFTLRGRGKLSEQDERDVTEAELPGLRAADAAANDGRVGPPGAPGAEPAREAAPGNGLRPGGLAIAAAGFLAGAAVARRLGTRGQDTRGPSRG